MISSYWSGYGVGFVERNRSGDLEKENGWKNLEEEVVMKRIWWVRNIGFTIVAQIVLYCVVLCEI
jgi:hypothetical protein